MSIGRGLGCLIWGAILWLSIRSGLGWVCRLPRSIGRAILPGTSIAYLTTGRTLFESLHALDQRKGAKRYTQQTEAQTKQVTRSTRRSTRHIRYHAEKHRYTKNPHNRPNYDTPLVFSKNTIYRPYEQSTHKTCPFLRNNRDNNRSKRTSREHRCKMVWNCVA